VVEENVALTVFSNGKELFKLDNLAMTIAEDDKLFQVGKVKDVSKASVEKTHKPIVPIKSSRGGR
jgi:hypothetical protein